MSFLQPGLANLPLTVQRRTPVVDAVTGQTSETWTDWKQIWARVEARGGFAKGEFSESVVGTERKVAVVDWRSDIKYSIKDHRLQSRGVPESDRVTYSIIEISNVQELRHKVELTLEELTP
tara:strand:+ start:127 stop:489 length:363 start_codon:yes stop_codon:yes gene_type:complete